MVIGNTIGEITKRDNDRVDCSSMQMENHTVKNNLDIGGKPMKPKWIVSALYAAILVTSGTVWAQRDGDLMVCVQVIAPAVSATTGECREFPTPCDVPAGWSAVSACPPPSPLTGVYVSQFAPEDPQAGAGGTDPVYMVVVEKGDTAVVTVNADYTHPTARWTSKVWTYAIVPTQSLRTGTTFAIDDWFGVCNNTVKVGVTGVNILMESIATGQKTSVANPLAIDCADLYPMPLTRTFVPLF